MLIINADDWGGWPEATDAALACFRNGRITSTSAMVFMQDSERAASLARDCGIDVGLHVNFTQPFTGSGLSQALTACHQRVCRFLRSSKYALILYHPLLRNHFHHLYRAQVEEFLRLYGKSPSHIDGHQHMHLCSNMLVDGIIPKGQKVRRSFSFSPGEKSFLNLAYRRAVDRCIARRHRATDFFFALSQTLEPQRFSRVADLAKNANVELMTHPAVSSEFEALLSDEYSSALQGIRLAGFAQL